MKKIDYSFGKSTYKPGKLHQAVHQVSIPLGREKIVHIESSWNLQVSHIRAIHIGIIPITLLNNVHFSLNISNHSATLYELENTGWARSCVMVHTLVLALLNDQVMD